MLDAAISHQELASRLTTRLCHDLVGPAGAVVSGLDLLSGAPPADEVSAAMELVDAGARKLLAVIVFSRVAFGHGQEEFNTGVLEALARGLFSDLRPTLDWSVEATSLAGTPARTLLNLVQIAADALPSGGVARAWATGHAGKVHLGVDAVGPRLKSHSEVLNGLSGEPRGAGLSGRWVQAYFVHSMVTAAGGDVAVTASDTTISFKATLP
jgi:histidine phosphotransferase ChpT